MSVDAKDLPENVRGPFLMARGLRDACARAGVPCVVVLATNDTEQLVISNVGENPKRLAGMLMRAWIWACRWFSLDGEPELTMRLLELRAEKGVGQAPVDAC